MIQWLKDLFSDSGTVSSMRLMCMIITITACYIAIKDSNAIGMVGTLLASAVGGKVLQKHAEAKEP